MMHKKLLFVIGGLLLVLPVLAHEEPNLTRLPVGDNKLSQEPQAGYVWRCGDGGGGGVGGARVEGPWFNGDGTFDLTAKAVVDGAVMWPSVFEMTIEGTERVFTGNGLPDHATGVYPVERTDDAAQYDPNPNTISEQDISFRVPLVPTLANEPSCMAGFVGILLTGSVLFDGLDAELRDAVAHETQDACQGHPQGDGQYHYHSLTSCLEDTSAEGEHSALMGYALDGFGIYGYYGENGELMTNDDLDACHGHTHEIMWEGELVEMYHYHATYEFPYTIGCFMGTPAQIMREGGPNAQGQPPTGGQPPAGGQGGQPPTGGQGGQPPAGGQGVTPPPPPGGGQGGQPPTGGQGTLPPPPPGGGQGGPGQPPPPPPGGGQGRP